MEELLRLENYPLEVIVAPFCDYFERDWKKRLKKSSTREFWGEVIAHKKYRKIVYEKWVLSFMIIDYDKVLKVLRAAIFIRFNNDDSTEEKKGKSVGMMRITEKNQDLKYEISVWGSAFHPLSDAEIQKVLDLCT